MYQSFTYCYRMYALDDIVYNEELFADIFEDSFGEHSIFQYPYEEITILRKDKQKVNLYVRAIPIGLNEVIPCCINRDKAYHYENLDPFHELPIPKIDKD